MDPFAAIGLAGNIIAFVDFGFRLISTAKNIYNSKSGTSANNEDLYSMTEQLQQLTIELKVARPMGSSSQQDRRLYDVAIECENVSVELSKLLDKLKTKDPGSKRQALKAAVRNWRKSDQKLELEKRLDRCKQQLSLELLSSIKTELLKRLSKLDGYSQTSENELRSLARNVESLRQGSNVYFLSVDALDQIRSLVQLSDEAISKVCQNRVLGALQFQSMGERFEDIGEVHTKTFDWIFDDKDIHTIRSEDFFVDSVSTDDGTRSSINSSGVADGADSIQESLESMESLEEEPSHNSSFAWHISDASLTAESNESVISLLESQPEPWRSSSAISNTKKIPESARQVIFKARDSFITWLESGSGVFHISGKPGSGKSTLMKYLVQHPKTKDHLGIWANGKNLVLGRFFFWKPGSDLQKNVKGLVRGLLHCVLSECPELIQLVFPKQWEASKQREDIHIDHHESRLAFERLIENQTYKQNKFVFFIDGLDEFEGHHADLARQIIKWTHGIQSVKFCISSREWPVFQDIFKDCLRIRLHELTRSDIRRFVGDRLCEMNFNLLMSKDGNMNDDNDESSSSIYEITCLKEDIVEGSDGVFLWVSLVLRHIENGIANGDRIQDLMKIVKSLPTELEPMLQQLLDSIPKTNRKLAYSMLSLAQFIITYENQVCLMQYSFLEEYVEDHNFAKDWSIGLIKTLEREERLERAERRIYGVCKGLLELRQPPAETTYPNILGGLVRFIHRSTTEFLESQTFKLRMGCELPEFDPFDAFCQTYLGQLKRIRLPKPYYFPEITFNQCLHRLCQNLDARVYDSLLCPYHPTFRQDTLWLITQQINLDRHRSLSEFSQFLNRIYRTVASLEMGGCVLNMRYYYRSIHCAPEDVLFISCIVLKAYEFLPLEEYADSKSIASYASSCLFSLGLNSYSEIDIPSNVLEILETLFHRGASPDSKLGATSGPEFHELLAVWCSSSSHWKSWRLILAIIAFMLYHGANPRFAVVVDKTIYTTFIDDENPVDYLKIDFESESPTLQPGNEAETIRLDNSGQRILGVPQETDIIKNHGHVINLRALVSIWFPDQCRILQQVIDYILEIGVSTQDHHRAELQTRFGPLLRPLFDRGHPEYVRSVRGGFNWPNSFP